MTASVAAYPAIPPPPAEQDQFVVLRDVTWQAYCALREQFDSPGVRLTYLEGALEIMSPSKSHERGKKRIARFVELFALERDIPLYGYGSSTLRKAVQARGLEPDECWALGRTLGDAEDDVPDIALEVVISSGGINKLAVYAGLGVPEVWYWYAGRFQVFGLVDDVYQVRTSSGFLPEFDFADLARRLDEPDEHAALKAFRDHLHGR